VAVVRLDLVRPLPRRCCHHYWPGVNAAVRWMTLDPGGGDGAASWEDVGVRDRANVSVAEVQLDGAVVITWNDWSVRFMYVIWVGRRREEVPGGERVSMYMVVLTDLSGVAVRLLNRG